LGREPRIELNQRLLLDPGELTGDGIKAKRGTVGDHDGGLERFRVNGGRSYETPHELKGQLTLSRIGYRQNTSRAIMVKVFDQVAAQHDGLGDLTRTVPADLAVADTDLERVVHPSRHTHRTERTCCRLEQHAQCFEARCRH
jgi:hypothetical protein